MPCDVLLRQNGTLNTTTYTDINTYRITLPSPQHNTLTFSDQSYQSYQVCPFLHILRCIFYTVFYTIHRIRL